MNTYHGKQWKTSGTWKTLKKMEKHWKHEGKHRETVGKHIETRCNKNIRNREHAKSYATHGERRDKHNGTLKNHGTRLKATKIQEFPKRMLHVLYYRVILSFFWRDRGD